MGNKDGSHPQSRCLTEDTLKHDGPRKGQKQINRRFSSHFFGELNLQFHLKGVLGTEGCNLATPFWSVNDPDPNGISGLNLQHLDQMLGPAIDEQYPASLNFQFIYENNVHLTKNEFKGCATFS